MRVHSEEKQREKLSGWCFRLAAASFIPLAGIAAGVTGLFLSSLGLYLGKKYPERFGGLWRLRLSLALCVLSIVLSFFELDAFFRYKFRQAEDARFEITMMRLYEVTEIMENYALKSGQYPAGKNAEEVGNILSKDRNLFFPTVDGWGKPLKIQADPWDYSVTADNPQRPAGRSFPVLRAQSPKPVFPFVGLYPGTVLDPVPATGPEETAAPVTPPDPGSEIPAPPILEAKSSSQDGLSPHNSAPDKPQEPAAAQETPPRTDD